MKRAALLLLLVLMYGCQQRAEHHIEYYEITFQYKSASPEELMEAGQKIKSDLASSGEVVRIVAGDEKLSLFLHSSQPKETIEQNVAKLQNIPELMPKATITGLPNGLPPKPNIELFLNYDVKINREKTFRMGITQTQIVNAIREARNSGIYDDVDALHKRTVKTPDGKTVPIGELAKVTTITKPAILIWEPAKK